MIQTVSPVIMAETTTQKIALCCIWGPRVEYYGFFNMYKGLGNERNVNKIDKELSKSLVKNLHFFGWKRKEMKYLVEES